MGQVACKELTKSLRNSKINYKIIMRILPSHRLLYSRLAFHLPRVLSSTPAIDPHPVPRRPSHKYPRKASSEFRWYVQEARNRSQCKEGRVRGLREMIKERCQGVPVSYVIGMWFPLYLCIYLSLFFSYH